MKDYNAKFNSYNAVMYYYNTVMNANNGVIRIRGGIFKFRGWQGMKGLHPFARMESLRPFYRNYNFISE